MLPVGRDHNPRKNNDCSVVDATTTWEYVTTPN